MAETVAAEAKGYVQEASFYLEQLESELSSRLYDTADRGKAINLRIDRQAANSALQSKLSSVVRLAG